MGIEIYYTPGAGGHIYTQFNVICVPPKSPLSLLMTKYITSPLIPAKIRIFHPVWVGSY